MKRNYLSVKSDGNPLSPEMLSRAAQSAAILLERLQFGGTVTIRANAFGVEGIWNPPSTRLPPLPEVSQTGTA